MNCIKCGRQMLQEIQDQTDKILQQEQDLNEKKSSLDNVKMTLMSQQTELQHKQDSLTAAQEDMAAKKITLAQDKAESDQLFAQLTAETGMYTEFRNEDKELTEFAEQQIQDLMDGVISADEVSEITTSDRDEKPTVIYKDTDVYNKSDAPPLVPTLHKVLSLRSPPREQQHQGISSWPPAGLQQSPSKSLGHAPLLHVLSRLLP